MARKILKDVAGLRFGRWTVLEELPVKRRHKVSYRMVFVRCECGRERSIELGRLIGGYSRSCGCRASETTSKQWTTHGKSKTREYGIWQGMKHRCSSPAASYFHRYGGRGITVCERWQSFANFFADMGPRPSPKHSLERINNDGNYEPGNVVWATLIEQGRNNSRNVNITYNGETLCASEWARRSGIHPDTLKNRLERGWTFERAITTPPQADCELSRRATAGLSAGLLF